jgi:SAM-dependent methyltransferase
MKDDLLGTATYSPEDNKLRIYPLTRLAKDEYERVKGAGFRWAPKQELFVAPAWTPEREDLASELCGEIEDEDKTLVERATERAERFEDYSESRMEDAQRARAGVSAIADNIPLGQPILVGHHSEKHARKDAQRIENGMRRAVKMWEQSEYWTRRANGAIRSAKYKERPDVRARRIKGIEADKRKQERYLKRVRLYLSFWSQPDLTHERALRFANCDGGWLPMPRKDGDREDFTGHQTAYGALSNSFPTLYAPRTLEEVVAVACSVYPDSIERAERWIAHYENRLAYEKAMLAEDGGTVADRNRPEVGGACRCWVARGWVRIEKVNKVSVSVRDTFDGKRFFSRTIPFDKLSEVISKADYESKGREQGAPPPPQSENPVVQKLIEASESFSDMRETLKNGVKIVVAPQLFPTPAELAARLVELAEIGPGERVLEPSAGTGRLLDAMNGDHPTANTLAIEINPTLAENLEKVCGNVLCEDFLATVPHPPLSGSVPYGTKVLGEFHRIVMNPPFENGADIRHIEHARRFLKPGGRLVALCANGPRQQDKLKPLASNWIELEPGAFASEGTNVNAAICVIEAETPTPTEDAAPFALESEAA